LVFDFLDGTGSSPIDVGDVNWRWGWSGSTNSLDISGGTIKESHGGIFV